MSLWTRLLGIAAVAGTGLAVVSGAAGWGTAHRVLAAVALPPLAALVAVAWVSARRLLAPSAAALAAFGLAALLVGRDVHLAFASLAFAATAFAAVSTFRGETEAGPWRDYVTLTKPRVMSLLLLTGVCGAFVGAGGMPPAAPFALTVAGLALACGGASALNHWYDRDIDRLMGARTSSRPVAAGRVPADSAFAYGVALSAFSFVLLDSLVNLPTALLALAGNLFYVLVYTRWLKRSTPQNIVIGGAAGAVPPLVGWAAATGNVAVPALLLFAIVFFWTPPHFWALALLIKRDYAAAGIPMLPVVRGDRATVRQIVIYSLALVAITVVPFVWGTLGLAYLIAALSLGGGLVWIAIGLARQTTPRRAAILFHSSLLYLALLFVAAALDAAV